MKIRLSSIAYPFQVTWLMRSSLNESMTLISVIYVCTCLVHMCAHIYVYVHTHTHTHASSREEVFITTTFITDNPHGSFSFQAFLLYYLPLLTLYMNAKIFQIKNHHQNWIFPYLESIPSLSAFPTICQVPVHGPLLPHLPPGPLYSVSGYGIHLLSSMVTQVPPGSFPLSDFSFSPFSLGFILHAFTLHSWSL